jgi:hypothetical protein
MGFSLQPSARADPVEVALDVELEHIPWIRGWSTCECGLSPRDSKTLEIETLPIGIEETHWILFCNRVIDHIGQKKPVGAAVSLNGSHSASLPAWEEDYTGESEHIKSFHTVWRLEPTRYTARLRPGRSASSS